MSHRNTRTTRFVQNSLSTAAYQLTAMLLGFVTPRLTMLFYGSHVNGLVVSVNEFLVYFRLVEAGLASAAVFSLYAPLAKRDYDGVSAIVSAARGYYNIAGYTFCGITVAFGVIYPMFVSVEGMESLSVFLLILAMGISGALEFFTLSRYRVLLTADMRTYMISLASMTSLILSTAFIVVLSYMRVNIIIVRLCASLTIIVRPLILSSYVKRHFPKVNAFAPPNKAALSRRWDAMYKQLTEAFQQGAGVMLTTIITRDTSMVSVYGTYHMVTVGLWGVLKMFTTGIYSMFGNLLVSGDKRKFQLAYKDFEYMYISLTTILFSVAAVLIVPFVVLYTDNVRDANYFAPAIGLLIVLEALTNHCKMPMDLMIIAAGKYRETRFHCTAQMATAAVLGLGLGFLGLRASVINAVCGVLTGMIASNILRTALMLYFVPKFITELPRRDTGLRIIRMFVEAAVIVLPFVIWPLNIDGFFKWITFTVPLTAYAVLVVALFGYVFDRKSLMSLVGRAKYLFQKSKIG